MERLTWSPWSVFACAIWLMLSSEAAAQACRAGHFGAEEQKRVQESLAKVDSTLSSLKGRVQQGTDIIDKWMKFSTEFSAFSEHLSGYVQRCREFEANLSDAEAQGHTKYRVPFLQEKVAHCRREEANMVNKLMWYQKEGQLIGSQIKEIEALLKDFRSDLDAVGREKKLFEAQRDVDSLVVDIGCALDSFGKNKG